MPGLSQDAISEAFLAACRAELAALKPGNVHVHAGGHGMEAHHFEASAVAAAPFVADAHAKVGARVLGAVEASLAAAGCNTNLGILLLTAPLAAAAQSEASGDLRTRVRRVLSALDAADAANVYEAIRRANPGGLGRTPEQDVAAPPTLPLREAMALAADRDRVARAYVTDMEEIFAFGIPTLEEISLRTDDLALAVTTLHMAYLAREPDSHVARKFGNEVAEGVRREAAQHRALWEPAATQQTLPSLLRFDQGLKERGLNPGTTADFVVATLFAAGLSSRMTPSRRA